MKTKLLKIVFVTLLFAPSIGVAETIHYTYDSLGRLTAVDYENGVSLSYTYDSVGNQLRYVVSIPPTLDSDNDGVPDVNDACPFNPNDPIGDPCNHDEDGDGILDEGDECPLGPNDDVGDHCNGDEDGDGIADGGDVCPFASDPNQENFDEDATGDACDNDVDGDGILNAQDFCGLTPVGDEINRLGCGPLQRACDVLTDVQGHEYQFEICSLVDNGYWPIQAGQVEFHPDELVTLKQEIDTIVSAAGFMEDALAFQGGVCANDRVISYAADRRIIKVNSCPSLESHRSLAAVIVEAGRAKIKQGQEEWIRFSNLSQGYNGPDYGGVDVAAPYGISNTYFNVAYMLDALIDFDENLNPADKGYGKQLVTKGEAAKIIHNMLELEDDPGMADIDVPDHIPYLQHAQQSAGFSRDYDVNAAMGKGDLLGLGMRLMKLEGCFDYADEVVNPFSTIPGDYEYIADLKAAVEFGILRNGEGDFAGAPGTWRMGYDHATDRRGAAIWLYRILREAVRRQCPAKQNCWTVYSTNRDSIHFQEQDWLANQLPLQATCDYVLGGLPLATVDGGGLIDTDFDGFPEAEETLVTIYRMLQVEP